MSEILLHYERVNPTSWAYLSSLLMLALFFKFNRVLSIRNIDLFILISLAPGLLLVQYSFENEGFRPERSLEMQKLGFQWLLAVGLVLTGRLLLDAAMVRRPLLDPNLNAAGLSFLGSSLLFFLMANVVTGKLSRADWAPALPAAEVAEGANGEVDTFDTEGPGFWWLYQMPRIVTQEVVAGASETQPETEEQQAEQAQEVREITARVMAILSHVMIVLGMVIIGARHFENTTTGIAAATMYLLLPYTALFVGSVKHALPASLLVWAVVLYRRPMLAGIMIGLASGTIYYPIFLLPLWCSFYWERGIKRFLTGVLLSIGVVVLTLALTAGSLDRFYEQLWQLFGVRLPPTKNLQGIWREGFWNPLYRLPLLFAFCALAISFVVWPVRKTLGTLMSCSAALMVAVQFWHGHHGGIYVAWYLPLLLLTIHRPNLEDRVAATMVSEGWWQARQKAKAARAA
jgi:hypothetical protein